MTVFMDNGLFTLFNLWGPFFINAATTK